MDDFYSNLFNIGSKLYFTSAIDSIKNVIMSDGLVATFSWIKIILAVFSFVIFFLVVLVMFKIKKLQSGDVSGKLKTPQMEKGKFSAQWDAILEKTGSQNPSDWKVAVIEADKLFDNTLKLLGYTGDTMGDRLKKLDVLHFPDLDNFWAAHKIRNRIVHNPDHKLSKQELDFVLKTYENVLRDMNAV